MQSERMAREWAWERLHVTCVSPMVLATRNKHQMAAPGRLSALDCMLNLPFRMSQFSAVGGRGVCIPEEH